MTKLLLPLEPRVTSALLRVDLGSFVRKSFGTLCPGDQFVPGFYIDTIACQLERLRRGEITRLIINMPPRSLKSLIASVAFPAFILGHDPTQRIICASYSSKLARYFIIDDPLKPQGAYSETKRTAVNERYCTRDFRFYPVDVGRGRVDYPTLKAKVLDLAQKWGARRILIEEAGSAIGLIQELRYQLYAPVGVKPERDESSRVAVASSKFEAGNVYLPERASWLLDLEAELFAFPGSRYDDQCDSISQSLNDPNATFLATYMKAWGTPGR